MREGLVLLGCRHSPVRTHPGSRGLSPPRRAGWGPGWGWLHPCHDPQEGEGAAPIGTPRGVASQMRSPWHTAQEMPARVCHPGDVSLQRRQRQDSRSAPSETFVLREDAVYTGPESPRLCRGRPGAPAPPPWGNLLGGLRLSSVQARTRQDPGRDEAEPPPAPELPAWRLGRARSHLRLQRGEEGGGREDRALPLGFSSRGFRRSEPPG